MATRSAGFGTRRPGPPRSSIGDMEQIINNRFLPEFERTQAALPGIQELFMERLNAPVDYSGLRGELQAVAEGVGEELFRPGGSVELASRGAAEGSVRTGFGPSSGGFDRARMNILDEAQGTIGRTISQGALQLAPMALQKRQGDIANAFGLLQLQSGRADDLRESLFGGRASIEQLKLARDQMKLNRRLVEAGLANQNLSTGDRIGGALSGAAGGALAGAQAGTIFGLPGAAVGGILGGLAGLF